MPLPMHGIGNKNERMNKRKLLLLIIILWNFSATAQYNSEGDVASRFRPGTMWFFTGFSPAQPEKLRKYDRLIVDLTYNDWTGDRKPFQVDWSSIGVNTNLMFDIPMSKNNLTSFGVGFCYGFQQYKHNQILEFDSLMSTTQFSKNFLITGNDYRTSFVAHNFSVPVEFRFRTKGWKHFKVHIGGKIGYQASLINKAKIDDNDQKYTVKYKSLPDVNRLMYSAHLRFGLRNWALFGSYNFNTLFKSSESVKLNTFQLGLSISLF